MPRIAAMPIIKNMKNAGKQPISLRHIITLHAHLTDTYNIKMPNAIKPITNAIIIAILNYIFQNAKNAKRVNVDYKLIQNL